MNKRSAMVVAAGLVAALLAGSAALSFSLSGGTAAAEGAARVKPIVKTERRTVTIHKKAKANPAEVVTISAPSTSGSSIDPSSGSSGSYDDSSEEPTEDVYEGEAEHETESQEDGFASQSSHEDSGSGESGGDD
jgi:hypothetical protein